MGCHGATHPIHAGHENLSRDVPRGGGWAAHAPPPTKWEEILDAVTVVVEGLGNGLLVLLLLLYLAQGHLEQELLHQLMLQA